MDTMDMIRNEREVTLVKALPEAAAEVVKDAILPDTYADIKKILATSLRFTPEPACQDENTIVCRGTLGVTVLFLTEAGETASLPIDCEYETALMLKESVGTLSIAQFPTVDNLQCRLINPRKIGVRAKVKVGLSVWEDADLTPIYPDTMTDDDRLTLEEKTERLPYTAVNSYTVFGVESGDDIHLDMPYPPIGKILLSSVKFSGISAEARDGAAAINANADITLWYLSDGEEALPVCLHHSLPISTLMECEGLSERDLLSASLYEESGSFTPTVDTLGEARVCECDITYAVSLTAFRETAGYRTADSYSTKYAVELQKGDLTVSCGLLKNTATARASATVPGKEGYLPIGAEAVVKQYRVEAGEDQRAILVGSATVFALLKESDGDKIFGESGDVAFSLPLSLPYEEDRTYRVTLSLASADTKANGKELSLSVCLSANVISWKEERQTAVIALSPIAEYPEALPCSFTVYYPKEGETAWEIAKKYRVSEDMLVFSESAKGAKSRRVVMIPYQKEPIFRGSVMA